MAISNTKERDIVVFLGAGFSHDADLPTMAEFGEHSQKEKDGLSKLRQSHKATPMLLEAADVFVQFQRFCKQSPILRDIDVKNMETIFCIAEAMSEAMLQTVTLDNQEYALDPTQA